jgi:thiol-disulfide isomerase/thioredoxin
MSTPARCLAAAIAAAIAAAPLHAQPPDAELRTTFDAWQAKWNRYADAMGEARRAGQLTKGGDPPPQVLALQQEAEDARVALLARFGARDDLSAASWLLVARAHETGRDYRSAVTAYERSLAGGKPDAPDLRTMHSLCIAAMNSKDDALAARWMKTTIEAEDRSGAVPGDTSIRATFYPRTLIALENWDALAAHLAALAKMDAPACRAAAATFGVVCAIHRGDLSRAQEGIDAIRSDPARFPDHQSWAVAVQLALCVQRGEFEEGARLVREFLAKPEPEGKTASVVDRNQRRYLDAVAPFLGKPAPRIHVDEWVGEPIGGDDVLAALAGRVVVLDFWQPWCEPCRKAMPKLVALQAESPEELLVLGLCTVQNYGYDVSERKAVRPIAKEDYRAHVADFRADMGINYPLAIARRTVNSDAYRVSGIPTLVVIDRQGIVRYMSCGAGEPGLLELAVRGVLHAK